jgi:hypothetical protein
MLEEALPEMKFFIRPISKEIDLRFISSVGVIRSVGETSIHSNTEEVRVARRMGQYRPALSCRGPDRLPAAPRRSPAQAARRG